ncbi:hypothetical protein KIN20_003541 [Parelaphostrongylus tenuis]|uniref:Uncharacterized protein n=1 Tax=Parelaphostrongylus tenuis TaxID=148309 RepID=A0AAD5M0D0_PARTN|nr:hypothetical protein KIN20_003541 [Parelaphostrongylus tenuis]
MMMISKCKAISAYQLISFKKFKTEDDGNRRNLHEIMGQMDTHRPEKFRRAVNVKNSVNNRHGRYTSPSRVTFNSMMPGRNSII